MTRARELRHRVEILVATESDDGAGGRTRTWPASGTARWADLRAVPAIEAALPAGGPVARDRYLIVMRREEAPEAVARIRPIDPPLPDLEIVGMRRLDRYGRYVEIDAVRVT